MINKSQMIVRPLYSRFFKMTCIQSTATTGLKNSTHAFFLRAILDFHDIKVQMECTEPAEA